MDTTKILEIVEAQLPAMAAGEMKKFIEQAQKDQLSLDAAQTKMTSLEEKIKTLTADRDNLKQQVLRNANLDDREREILRKEQEVELSQLKFNIEKQIPAIKEVEANKRADSLFTLVGLLAKNSDAGKSVFSNEYKTFQPDYDNNTGRSIQRESGKTIHTSETESPLPAPGTI